MLRLRVCSLLLVLIAILSGGCGDNVGSVWDRDKGGGGGENAAQLAVVPLDGRLVEGRPRVEEAFPKGSGWPTTVPIVVLFNESILRDSVVPPSPGGGTGGGIPGVGSPARVFLRAEGTQQALPASVGWLYGDRAVVLSSTTALPRSTSFEVVVDPEVRDVDGIRIGGTEPEVVATFRTDQAETIVDGRVVAVLPRDNARQVQRGADVVVVFDRPIDPASVTETTFRVEAGTVPVEGDRDFPIEVANVPDPRFLRFRPDALLAPDLQHGVVLEETLKFGASGVLQIDGRVPFSVFTTLRPGPPTAVSLGSAVPGYPGKVNVANVSNVLVDVALDDSVPAGSRVRARIYGLDADTEAEEDLAFVEQFADVPQAGPTTVTVRFESRLGLPGNLRFEEGPLTIVASVETGAGSSGFSTTAEDVEPALDVTAPVIDSFLPQVAGSSTDIVTDQESIAVFGRASEQLGTAELTAGGITRAMHGSNDDGDFVMRPILLGQRSEPLPFTLSATDAAGNSIAIAVSGLILQRGVVTGALGSELVVEVYDEATFQPVPGATVVVDPDLPQKPATGQRVATTGADGRATFTNPAAARHTVTVVAPGYDLTSVVDTPAGFVSLPVRPMDPALATADLSATLGFIPTAGQTGLLGCNEIADPLVLQMPTQGTPPNQVPAFDVRPNRPLVVNALTGVFPPLALPAFSGYACGMCGVDGLTPSPPAAPIEPGGSRSLTLPILPSIGAAIGLASPYEIDFAAAGGLGALAGEPEVRVHGTLSGFGGAALFGAGMTTVVAGSRYSVNSSHALPVVLALQDFQPTLWVSTTARDGDGNVTRHRQLVSDPNLGLTFSTGAPLGVPTVQPPAGASLGAPAVTYEDRLDPAVIPGGVGFVTLRVADSAGREWRLVRVDVDGVTGPETLQLPDLSSAGVIGLAPGTWEVRADAELMFSTAANEGSYVLEERRRQQVKLARAAPVVFDVQ